MSEDDERDKLKVLERELGKSDSTQKPKSVNNQWKDNLKLIGLMGLAIVLIVVYIRNRIKSGSN